MSTAFALWSTRRIFLGEAGAALITTAAPVRASEVSARDFGARGDGLHDDTEALQRALDAGMPIFLPEGIYPISSTLHLGDGAKVRGSGPRSVLKKTSEQVDRVLQNSHAGEEIQLVDFAVDGSRVSKQYVSHKDGILLSKCTRCVLQGLVVKNCLNDGIIIEYGTRNTVTNCTATGNAKDGIYLSGAEHCKVIKNHCEENDVAGIAIAASWWIAVSGNRSANNGAADLMLGRDDYEVEVLDNELGPGSDYSIFVSAEPLPDPQTLHGMRYPGGDIVYGARECVVRSNTLRGKVSLILFDDGLVEGNTISGSNAQGLLLHGSSRNRVLANRISGWSPAFPGLQLAALDIDPRLMAPNRLRSGSPSQVYSEDNVLDGNVLLGGAQNAVHITGRNRLNGRSAGD